MPSELQDFLGMIAPFRSLWRTVRVSGAAVLHQGRWMSLRTRLMLSTSEKAEQMFIEPTNYFAAFACTRSISELDDILSHLENLGAVRINASGKSFDVFATLAHAGLSGAAHPVHFHNPWTNTNEQHDCRFNVGENFARLLTSSSEQHYSLINDAQLNVVSSKLRVGLPRYRGLDQLFSTLNLPFDLRQMNTTMMDVLAPLPFSLSYSDSLAEVQAPCRAAGRVSVVGFFENGTADVTLSCPEYSEGTEELVMTGAVPWPDRCSEGKLFLYYDDQEIGHCSIRRWTGTRNWKVTVDTYFDSEWGLLKQHLSARKDARQFERAVTRLCGLLGAPAIWYGDKEFDDKADVCAFVSRNNEWAIILGECTGQKPAAKFTPLLNRKNEIEHILDRQVRVVPTVFTPSVVSLADRRLAAQDGIALIGHDELVELLDGVEREWGADDFLNYLSRMVSQALQCGSGALAEFQY